MLSLKKVNLNQRRDYFCLFLTKILLQKKMLFLYKKISNLIDIKLYKNNKIMLELNKLI